jgi:NAD(P)-dependent dehydrogenase (short-subunit alcohol dehydrogenase family)
VSLEGKVILVTGGTGDLGRVVTERFCRAGAKTTTTYIYEREVRVLEEATRALKNRPVAVKCDVTKERGVQRAARDVAKKHGRLDVLVCLVGGYLGGPPVAETSERDWDYMLDLNLKSAFLACKAAAPVMARQRSGRIVCVSSRAGLRGEPGAAAYSAAKAGVLRLVEALAEELKGAGVTVNAVCPSILDTPANRRVMPDGEFSAWVKPGEVAEAILFLAGDGAKSISGAAIPVYGRA